jgi:hypothetical protein
LVREKKLSSLPLTGQVAAVSMGVVDGVAMLDLDYGEDSNAEVDMNLVGTADGRIIELQGTGEKTPYDRAQLDALLDLGNGADLVQVFFANLPVNGVLQGAKENEAVRAFSSRSGSRGGIVGQFKIKGDCREGHNAAKRDQGKSQALCHRGIVRHKTVPFKGL